MRRAEIIGRDNCQGVTSGPLPCWVRLEPPGAPDSRPVMKGTALLNLYLAVLENGVPSASLRREPMVAHGNLGDDKQHPYNCRTSKGVCCNVDIADQLLAESELKFLFLKETHYA